MWLYVDYNKENIYVQEYEEMKNKMGNMSGAAARTGE